MDESVSSTDEKFRELSTDEFIRRTKASVREAKAREPEVLREKLAIDVAGSYLKQAALALARDALKGMGIQNDDDRIARVETMLRVARHVRRITDHHGDTVPSLQRPDGSRIHLVARLIEIIGRDRVIMADESDDPDSRSKANKAIREAREDIKKVARDVLNEGEILA